MRDQSTFEARLTDALERYAVAGPLVEDSQALAARLVASRRRRGFGALGWPWSRTARLALVAALLGGALVAGLLAAGMLPKEPTLVVVPGRILVWQPTAADSGFASMLDSNGNLLWSRQMASRGCPELLAGSGIATRGFGTMDIRTDDGELIDRLDVSYMGGERWAPDRRAIALVDMDQGPITVVRFGRDKVEYGRDGELAGAIEAALANGGDRAILAVRRAAGVDFHVLENGNATVVHREAGVDSDAVWLSIAPDGSRAAAVLASTATGQALVRILSLPDGTVLSDGPTLDGADMTSVRPISWSPDGRHFALGVGADLHLYDASSNAWAAAGVYSRLFGEPSRWRSGTGSPLGLASLPSNRLSLYRQGQESVQRFLGGIATAFSPDGSLVASVEARRFTVGPSVRVAFFDVWGDGGLTGAAGLALEHPAPPDGTLQPCIDWQPGE